MAGFLRDSEIAAGKALKIIAALALAILAVVAIDAGYDYFAARAAKKAEVDAYWRRSHLTPEQRLAEDRIAAEASARTEREAAERAAAEAQQQRIAAIDAANRPFKAACKQALLSVLNDPDTARLERVEGSINPPGEFTGVIFGRARNAFGAMIYGEWLCEAHQNATTITVKSIKQIRP